MNMEQFLSEVGKQVPSLAVLAFVVWTYIKHMETSQKAWRETVVDINKQNLEDRALTRITMGENARATAENTKAIAVLTQAVNSLATKH